MQIRHHCNGVNLLFPPKLEIINYSKWPKWENAYSSPSKSRSRQMVKFFLTIEFWCDKMFLAASLILSISFGCLEKTHYFHRQKYVRQTLSPFQCSFDGRPLWVMIATANFAMCLHRKWFISLGSSVLLPDSSAQTTIKGRPIICEFYFLVLYLPLYCCVRLLLEEKRLTRMVAGLCVAFSSRKMHWSVSISNELEEQVE